MPNRADLASAFRQKFGDLHALYRAPGRVNVIGEHTDYNGGFVLPVALDFSCLVAASRRSDAQIAVYSENTGELVRLDLRQEALRRTGTWSDYPAGVAWALLDAGFALRGACLYIRGEVPLGAGLSSSAALEVAVGYALLDLAGIGVDLRRLPNLCQRAENEFVGARVGIMDQFVACHGRVGNALLLDCRSLESQLVPIPSGISLVICNTMVKHELASNEYNVRRSQCEEGVHLLAAAGHAVSSLRDVSMEILESSKTRLPDVIYRRCRHVVSENTRTLSAVAALRHGDLSRVGELMLASHRSLREDYEVSSPELDLLVELAGKEKGIIGARMTGGGFGGCTVNLVRTEAAPDFQEHIASAYGARTGRHPEIYLSQTASGVERLR